MDFDHATDADRARAKALAEAAGWRQQGFRYVHPTRGNYLTKDMDGWIDLCDNEGIDWVAPSDAVNESAEARLREADAQSYADLRASGGIFPEVYDPVAKMTEDQIKYMVDRFLGWKLPRDTFNPDYEQEIAVLRRSALAQSEEK